MDNEDFCKKSNKPYWNYKKNTSKNFCNVIGKEKPNIKTIENELILIYNSDLKTYELAELDNRQISNNSYIFGLDKNSNLRNIKIDQIIEYPNSISYKIAFKHGTLSLSEHHSLLSVDKNLNIIKIPVKKIEVGMPILMPRQINIIENHSPLDFSNCGEVFEEDGIEYVKRARTKAFRFIKKDFDLGYILGHYCSEGSMNQVVVSCGNQKAEIEKVSVLVENNFGFSPSIGKHDKKRYDTVYTVDAYSQLAKLIFTIGIGLKPKYAPLKEIPPFMYNAPKECVKGFLVGFTKGDGSIGDYIRNREFQASPSRDVLYRLNSSSKKLIFGLNFLLKRFGVVAEFKTREFDNKKHPTWHDSYVLAINSKANLKKLREFIPDLPEYGKFARGKDIVINLNPWMKKINEEMKRMYKISLRMLAERKNIPFIAAKCSQEQFKKNISEYRLLKTLKYLIQNDYKTLTTMKLWEIFSKFTFTRVKEVEINCEHINAYKLIIPYFGIHIAGIG
ncbi:MAG: LAGLIDADG family homing endonuclease, partial [Promethearchaeota archaeon]